MSIEGQSWVSSDGINPGADKHSTVYAFSAGDPQRLDSIFKFSQTS